MTPDQIAQAVALLAERDGVRQRMTKAAGAGSVADLYAAISGLPQERQILEASRQNVTDFLQVALAQIEQQLTALGVTGLSP